MTNDVVQTIIALGALIISIVSAIYTYIESKKTRAIGYANIEFVISTNIRDAESRVADISVDITEYQESENISQKVMKTKTLRYKQAVESMLNAYEESCTKYLDNKIDKDRFKINYNKAIRQLVENDELSEYFDAVKSSYKGILKVYREWNDLEK